MSTAEDGARLRRLQWRGQVVEAGTAKGPLYESLSLVERLQAFAELNRRAWLATGQDWPEPLPRSEWPGQIFELSRD